MGSWGYQALDSDQALDWIGPVLDKVADDINKLLDRIDRADYWDEGELRAAAHLFCVANVDFHAMRKCDPTADRPSTRERLIKALTEYRNNDDYMSAWSDPARAKAEIDKEIARLQDPEGNGQPRSTTLGA
jgi:hypothetical protein